MALKCIAGSYNKSSYQLKVHWAVYSHTDFTAASQTSVYRL